MQHTGRPKKQVSVRQGVGGEEVKTESATHAKASVRRGFGVNHLEGRAQRGDEDTRWAMS
jgi:hypothetical protein